MSGKAKLIYSSAQIKPVPGLDDCIARVNALTDELIAAACPNVTPSKVRLSAMWFQYQDFDIKSGKPEEACALKHIIETWAGSHIGWIDVEAAAQLLGIKGKYPRFSISKRLVLPPLEALEAVDQSNKHFSHYQDRPLVREYSRISNKWHSAKATISNWELYFKFRAALVAKYAK